MTNHVWPHAKPATELPIGSEVVVTNPRNGKKVIYNKVGFDQWTSNVFTGLRYAADNAVGWWLTFRAHKTAITK